MSISVDDVYKQVLAITNKEGRGYIPAPEFNVLARKAQLDIFENTFHDYKMALLKPQHQHKLADDIDMLKEKIAPFRNTGVTLSWNGTDGTQGDLSSTCHWLESVYEGNSYRTVEITFPAKEDISDEAWITLGARYSGDGGTQAGISAFRVYFNKSGDVSGDEILTGRIFINISATTTAAEVAGRFISMINDTSPYHSATLKSGSTVTLSYNQDDIDYTEVTSDDDITFANASTVTNYATYEEVDKQDWIYITSGGAKLKPTTSRPVFNRLTKVKCGFYPPLTGNIKHDYITKPTDPKWIGTTDGEFFQYSSGSSNDFELHASEEGSLVNKILELTGISMNKLEIAETALRNEQLNEADKNN